MKILRIAASFPETGEFANGELSLIEDYRYVKSPEGDWVSPGISVTSEP